MREPHRSPALPTRELITELTGQLRPVRRLWRPSVRLAVIGLLLLRGGNKDSGTTASDEDLVPAAGSGSSGTATQVLDDASQKPDSTT